MADFVYTRGYLTAAEDLGWRRRYPGDASDTTILPKAYLRGSDHVNDVARASGGSGEMVIYATDAGLSFVYFADADDCTDTDYGYATLSGGFTRVWVVGDYAYAVSKTNPSDLYRVDISSLTPGADNTPGGWSPYVDSANGVVYTDIHGGTPNGDEKLYVCYTAGGQGHVLIYDIASSTAYDTTLGESSGTGAGFFPRGDYGDDLYWCRGSQIYRKKDVHNVSAGSWSFDESYGRFDHQFPGTTQDKDNIAVSLTGNMTSCFDFTTADKATFSTTCTAGDSAGYAQFLGYMVGECSAYVDYSIGTLPGVTDGDAEVGIELISDDGLTVIRMAHKINWSGGSDQQSHEGTLIVGGVDETPAGWSLGGTPPSSGNIGVSRHSIGATTVYTIKVIGGTISATYAGREEKPLKARVYVKIDSGDALVGEFSDFRSQNLGDAVAPAGYTDLPTGNIAAAAVSEIYPGGLQGLVFAHTVSGGDDQCSFLLYDASDTPDYAQIVTTVDSGDLYIPTIRSACVDRGSLYTSAYMVFGGDNGAVLYEVNAATSAATFKRHFTEAWDHSQPLTGLDVNAVDYGVGGFAYGCAVSSLYSAFHGASGDIYDPGSGVGGATTSGAAPSGGCGYIIPDFDGAVGTSGQARAKNSSGINISALFPDPIPDDFLHAHLERNVDGGGWERLEGLIEGGDLSWAAVGGLAPGDGFEFTPDDFADYESAGLAFNHHDLTTGIYQYRWVFHDEAGNAETLTAVTEYGDAEYLDTPVPQSISINGGAVVTSYSTTFTMSGTSGATTGVTDAIYQVKAWMQGASESAAPWQDYSAGMTYHVLLSGSDGIKTVNVKVRHVSGQEASTTADCELALCVGASSPVLGFENILIAYSDGLVPFTSDLYGISETGGDGTYTNSDFPLTNMQSDDANVRWQSTAFVDWTGGSSVSGYTTRTASFEIDFGAPEAIGLVGIVGHNFNSQSVQSFISGGGFVHAAVVALDSGGSVLDTFSMTGLEIKPIMLVRPQYTATKWRITVTVKALSVVWGGAFSWVGGDPDATHLEIGRVIVQRTSSLWQPDYNPDQGIEDEFEDQSVVNRTEKLGLRAIERERIEAVTLDWSGDSIQSESDYNSLNTIHARNKGIRPVLYVEDPHNVATGGASPDDSYTAVYGYLDQRLRRTRRSDGTKRATGELSITSAAGVSSE